MGGTRGGVLCEFFGTVRIMCVCVFFRCWGYSFFYLIIHLCWLYLWGGGVFGRSVPLIAFGATSAIPGTGSFLSSLASAAGEQWRGASFFMCFAFTRAPDAWSM